METITTEKDLIAALSVKGRYLELCGDFVYRVRESTNGEPTNKAVFFVAEDVGDNWSDAHDDDSPEYGPWCSTWHLPEFWTWGC